MGRVITALEVQKRNKDRVSVYLDDEFAFGLPITDAAQLRKGQELSDEEIEKLRAIDAVARAFDRALRLLARRPYSVAEIRRNLSSKEIAEPVIDEVIERLKHLGYVDDRAFANYWIENRERFKPRGARALRYELRQKGIAQADIDAALSDLDGAESAYQAAQEKVRRLRGLTQREFKAKLGAFLARRGFSYDVVRETADRLIKEFEETDPEYFVSDNEQPYEE